MVTLIGLSVRLLIAAVFLTAAIFKCVRVTTFAAPILSVLDAAGIRTSSAVRIAVYAIPAIELAIAVCLFIGPYVAAGLIAAVGVLSVFTMLAWRALRNDYQGACGCFSLNSDRRMGPADVLFNAILIVGGLIGVVLLSPATAKPLSQLSAAEIEASAIAGLLFVLVTTLFTFVEPVWTAFQKQIDSTR